MFDFDVVTGPTQPPHVQPAEEPVAPAAASAPLAVAAAPALLSRPESHPAATAKRPS